MKQVELHQAFFWTCEECGGDNFARAITVAKESMDIKDAMASIQKATLRMGAGIGVFRLTFGGDFLANPETVSCQHCGEEFRTTEEFEDKDD